MQELRRPAADVLKELDELANKPGRQQGGSRVRERLLMIAVGYRLTEMDELLMLLPLTAETDYVQWFSIIAQHIVVSGGKAAMIRQADGTMQQLLEDDSPLSAELLSRFKVRRASVPVGFCACGFGAC